MDCLTENENMDTEMGEIVDLGSIHESLAIAERLAQASLLTSPDASRRLTARRIQMEQDGIELPSEDGADTDPAYYVPPKQLLLYLVR